MSTSTNVGSASRSRSILFIVFGVSMLLANAILTAQFGMEFLGGTWGAILMLLFFDIAAISWYTARLMSGLSGDQRAVAQLVSICTIVGSTLVSVVQVLMMREAMDPGLSPIIATAAVWLVTVFATLNFLALFFFQYSSVRERNIAADEELKAQTADEVASMKTEAHSKAMDRARTTLMGKTDAIGARIARDVERDFLRSMGCLDMLDMSPPAPARAPTIAPTLAPDQGADAGAVKVEKPARALSNDCDCGMPIGTGEGECDYELGGPGCMIDEKAAEERAARTATEEDEDPAYIPLEEPLDLGK